MWSSRSDLALDRDPFARFMPWLIAFMVYLAVLSMAALLVLNTTAVRWQAELAGTLTIQIPAAESVEADQVRVRTTLEILRTIPEVARAEAIPQSHVALLLKPWLGEGDLAAELPLPRLVDVTARAGTEIDVGALMMKLGEAVPGAVVDDHGLWLQRLLHLIRTVEVLATMILVLIGLTIAATVVFATRSGLAIHFEAIQVLHLIGANDGYVAGQFAGRAMTLGLKGGMIGLAIGVATLVGIGRLAARLQDGSLAQLSLLPAHWALIIATPVVVAFIAMLTARITVMRNLATML